MFADDKGVERIFVIDLPIARVEALRLLLMELETDEEAPVFRFPGRLPGRLAERQFGCGVWRGAGVAVTTLKETSIRAALHDACQLALDMGTQPVLRPIQIVGVGQADDEVPIFVRSTWLAWIQASSWLEGISKANSPNNCCQTAWGLMGRRLLS